MSLFLFLLLYSLSFLATGLWLALKALERRWLPKEFLYIGALAASLTIYYAVFYLYLLSPAIAGILVKILFLLSLLAMVQLVRRFRKSSALFAVVRKFFLVPLLITAVVMSAYSTIFYSCVSRVPATAGYGEMDNRTFCHTADLPFDNSLAFVFGENILKNEDAKLAIDWHLVDRPPLQIAASLPILDQGSHAPPLIRYVSYHLFSVFLQLSWLAALWGAFQLLKIHKKYQILAFVALGTTGFFYLNSVFIWPKLLAASLVFTGVFTLLGKSKQSKYQYLPFSALLIALGILSHSAVLFTIIPFAAYYLFILLRLRKVNLKYLGAALAIGLLVLAPWFIYKGHMVKTDRLAKWHFAGIISHEDKRGTVETITQEYEKLSFNDWTNNKEVNVKTLITGNFVPDASCAINFQGVVTKCMFKEWKTRTFFSTLFAFELLGLGLLAVIYQFIRRKIDLLDIELVLLVVASLTFWVVVMFQPGGTVVHQGSYATMMLAFLLMIKKLAELPKAFLGTIAVLQVVLFYLTWIATYIKLV